MAYFGRKPRKPGSVPGAASGSPVPTKGTAGRRERSQRHSRSLRKSRNEREQR